ncbi:hypothetical protein SAMD00019534_106340, partial [Acytostelium subglobosum LB1]|uniref:hypothetical protein n=1 Tax=Acytostelium subglobosum LB1 TaxID=1410327 RepID=UPI000645083B
IVIMATAQTLGGTSPFQTITVARDYSDRITKFDRTFPQELNGKVTQSEFEHTVDKINAWLKRAETIDIRNVCEELLGCLTFFTSYLWYQDKYSVISMFLQEQNDTVYYNRGVSWINPVNNGFLKVCCCCQLTPPKVHSLTNSLVSNQTTNE